MCECGCGEFTPFARFAGPNGVTYTVSTYLSVDCGCGNPAGVVITRVTAEILDSWGMEERDITDLPELTFDSRGHDAFVAVIGKDALLSVAREALDGDDETPMLPEEISDMLGPALRLTARHTP